MVRVCLVEGNQFVKDVKEQIVSFALIPRKTKKQNELEHAPEIEYLLVESQDIISDNVPMVCLL